MSAEFKYTMEGRMLGGKIADFTGKKGKMCFRKLGPRCTKSVSPSPPASSFIQGQKTNYKGLDQQYIDAEEEQKDIVL